MVICQNRIYPDLKNKNKKKKQNKTKKQNKNKKEKAIKCYFKKETPVSCVCVYQIAPAAFGRTSLRKRKKQHATLINQI